MFQSEQWRQLRFGIALLGLSIFFAFSSPLYAFDTAGSRNYIALVRSKESLGSGVVIGKYSTIGSGSELKQVFEIGGRLFYRNINSPSGLLVFKNSGECAGGCVLLDSAVIVATNRHVLSRVQFSIVSMIYNGDTNSSNDSLESECEAQEPDLDIGLVFVEPNNPNFKFTFPKIRYSEEGGLYRLQDSEQTVFSVGNPRGFPRHVSRGIFSTSDGVRILHSAATNPGSSGGGLFDSQTNLLGINTLKVANSEGISFAITMNVFVSKLLTTPLMCLTRTDSPFRGKRYLVQPVDVMSLSNAQKKAYVEAKFGRIDAEATEWLNHISSPLLNEEDERKFRNYIDMLSDLIRIQPSFPDLYDTRAWLYHKICYGRSFTLSRAILVERFRICAREEQDLRSAVSLGFGNNPDTLFRLSQLLEVQGRRKEGLEIVDELIRIEPKTKWYLSGKAFRLRNYGWIDEAIGAFRKLEMESLRDRPESDDYLLDSYENLERLFLARGDFESALRYRENCEALAKEKALGDGKGDYGGRYCRNQSISERLHRAIEAVKKSPTSGQALQEMAGVRRELYHYDAALNDYNRVFELGVKDYCGRGWVNFQLQNYDAAVRDYSECSKLQGESSFTFHMLAEALLMIGNEDEAMAADMNAVRADKAEQLAKKLVGPSAKKLTVKERKQTVRELEEIGQHPYFFSEMAWKASTKGDYKSAVRHLKACLEKFPRNLECKQRLSEAYLNIGKFEDAKILATQAIDLSSSGFDLMGSRLCRGLSSLGMKQYSEAAKDFSSVLETGEDFSKLDPLIFVSDLLEKRGAKRNETRDLKLFVDCSQDAVNQCAELRKLFWRD